MCGLQFTASRHRDHLATVLQCCARDPLSVIKEPLFYQCLTSRHGSHNRPDRCIKFSAGAVVILAIVCFLMVLLRTLDFRLPFWKIGSLREALYVLVILITVSEGTGPKLPKMCLRGEEGPLCETRARGQRVTCRGDFSGQYHKEYWTVRVAYLCHWSEPTVSPEDILRTFPVVEKLAIRHGNVSSFLSDFPPSRHLEALFLNDLIIEGLRPSLFASLESLKLLDLSRNLLKRLKPGIILQHPSLVKVFLSGNPWNCSQDLSWILQADSRVADWRAMECGGDSYPGKPAGEVMSLLKSMREDCPSEACECSMPNIVWDTTKRYLVPVITVNCSGQGLRELPASLPRNTTTLLLRDNHIADLQPLVQNPAYADVADIYLDGNQVRSVDVLEGADWLRNFRVLALRGNQLSELPTYALDNAFERNTHMVKIYLGSNPWRCDCLFTPEFQHLLIKYDKVVKDVHDVRCADVEDDENSLVQILELSKSSICQQPSHQVNPLDVLSGVLASLILLVLGKLLYDYWTFKKTGKLPWLVAKMP